MKQDLGWLLGAVSVEAFFRDNFEKTPLHITGRSPDFYERLFTPGDLEAVVHQSADHLRRTLKTSRMFAAQAANRAPSPGPGPGDDLARWIEAVLGSGDSILFGDLAQAWLPLGRLTREVEAALLTPVAASLFLSPADATGFPIHFDTYDTMVLQISGAKDWTVHQPTVALPAHAQNHPIDLGALDGPVLQVRLQPGDLLYMPRGFIHATSTNDAPSLHITLISLPYRWGDLLHDLVDAAIEREAALRRHVPLGSCRAIALGAAAGVALQDELAATLRRCGDGVDATAPVTRHLTRFIGDLAPLGAPAMPLPGARENDAEELVAKKPGTICQIHDDGDRVVIRFPGGHVRGPATTRSALQFIAAAEAPFRPDDLPGPLSPRSKRVLVERLRREGLLEASRA